MGAGEKGLVKELQKLREELEEVFRAESNRLKLEVLLCSRTSELIDANEALIAEITAREKAEKGLAEYEEVYRKLLDSVNDAVFAADAGSGRIIQANRAAGSLIGRPVDEIPGMHQTELHPFEDFEYYSSMFRKAVECGAGQNIKMLVRDSGGSPVRVEASAFTSVMDGRLVIWGIFRDISRHKWPESERARINLLIDELSRRLSA